MTTDLTSHSEPHFLFLKFSAAMPLGGVRCVRMSTFIKPKAEGGIESGELPNILTTSLKVRTAAWLPHLPDIGECNSQAPPGIAHLCGNLLELLTFARDARRQRRVGRSTVRRKSWDDSPLGTWHRLLERLTFVCRRSKVMPSPGIPHHPGIAHL